MVTRFKESLTVDSNYKRRVYVRKLTDAKYLCEEGCSFVVACKELGIEQVEVIIV